MTTRLTKWWKSRDPCGCRELQVLAIVMFLFAILFSCNPTYSQEVKSTFCPTPVPITMLQSALPPSVNKVYKSDVHYIGERYETLVRLFNNKEPKTNYHFDWAAELDTNIGFIIVVGNFSDNGPVICAGSVMGNSVRYNES